MGDTKICFRCNGLLNGRSDWRAPAALQPRPHRLDLGQGLVAFHRAIIRRLRLEDVMTRDLVYVGWWLLGLLVPIPLMIGLIRLVG
jgi:hypothetical protein